MWTERAYEARMSPMKQTNIRYLLAHAGGPFHGWFRSQKRTFHAGDTFHGRFSGQGRTFHAEGQYRGWFDVNGVNPPCWKSISWMVHVSEANLPRWRSISWMVQYEITEPSMLEVQITDGSGIPSRKFCTWKQQPAGKRAHSGAQRSPAGL